MHCPRCGIEVPAGANFCPRCAAPLGQAAPPMPPPPAKQPASPQFQQGPAPPSPPPPPPAQAPPPYQYPPQYPPQYQPPTQYPPPPVQQATPPSTFMVGAIITAIVGALLLLVGEFAGASWGPYYARDWLSIGLTSNFWSAAIILLLVLGLLLAAYIAKDGLKAPLPVGRLRTGFILSTAVTISVFVLGLAFAIVAIASQWDSWWIGAGGWGGLGGGLLTAMFFYMALKQAKATAAPYQMPAQPMPQPYPQTGPTMAPPRGP